KGDLRAGEQAAEAGAAADHARAGGEARAQAQGAAQRGEADGDRHRGGDGGGEVEGAAVGGEADLEVLPTGDGGGELDGEPPAQAASDEHEGGALGEQLARDPAGAGAE